MSAAERPWTGRNPSAGDQGRGGGLMGTLLPVIGSAGHPSIFRPLLAHVLRHSQGVVYKGQSLRRGRLTAAQASITC